MSRVTDTPVEMLFCGAQKLAEEATGVSISIFLSFSLSPSDQLYQPKELLVTGLRSKAWNTGFWFA